LMVLMRRPVRKNYVLCLRHNRPYILINGREIFRN
jgi:hypothetical protein